MRLGSNRNHFMESSSYTANKYVEIHSIGGTALIATLIHTMQRSYPLLCAEVCSVLIVISLS
jgi:hypothetical protein